MKYNYYNAVRDDITSYYINYIDDLEEWRGRSDELYDYLYDEFMNSDEVTGNISESYTFNINNAEDNLSGNDELLMEALKELDYSLAGAIAKGAEWCDVIIRCYVLAYALQDFIDCLERNDEI